MHDSTESAHPLREDLQSSLLPRSTSFLRCKLSTTDSRSEDCHQKRPSHGRCNAPTKGGGLRARVGHQLTRGLVHETRTEKSGRFHHIAVYDLSMVVLPFRKLTVVDRDCPSTRCQFEGSRLMLPTLPRTCGSFARFLRFTLQR